METLFNSFLAEKAKADNGNKAAGVRARKLSFAIEKELKAYRRKSLEKE